MNDIEQGDVESSKKRITSLNECRSFFTTELLSLSDESMWGDHQEEELKIESSIPTAIERTKESIQILEEKIKILRKAMKEMFMERSNVNR